MDLYEQHHFSPLELEFMAENEMIDICPSVSLPYLQFLSGTYGPLQAGVNISVPLWLAITLKENNKARIVIPDWLHCHNLKAALKSEDESPQDLTDVPFHFVEIAEMILRAAEDDCAVDGNSAEEMSNLLCTLIVTREKKIQKRVEEWLKNTKSAEWDSSKGMLLLNASAMELAELREGFLKVSLPVFLSLVAHLSPLNSWVPSRTSNLFSFLLCLHRQWIQ